MRTLIILSLFLLSCTHEAVPTLVKTKRYVGTYQEGKENIIVTSHAIIHLKDSVHVPDSAWCYVRVEPCLYDYHPDIARRLERHYFSWRGSEKEYLMENRIKF